MNARFWQNKTVFITGHTGFKGSWLSLWLQHMGAKVVGYSLAPPTNPSLFQVASVEKNMTSYIADIRDYELLQQTLQKHQPEIIFHLAAQPLVRYSYQNPIETYATNVMGTVHLFEAARKLSACKAIVNITSDKCYENKEWLWGYREEDELGGYDPYSNSKACAELVTSAYQKSFFNAQDKSALTGVASVRAGNVIGGGDWATDRLIPDIMRGIFKNETIVLRYPESLRPWQHVLEPLHGYLQVAEKIYQEPSSYSSAWNFGPSDDDVKPVSWIVDYLLKLNGNKSRWELDTKPKPHEAQALKLDSSKAKKHLAWKPLWKLDQALTETMNWFTAFHAGKNMHEHTLLQIEQYLAT